MRIVFFGSGEFGQPTLRALCQIHKVSLIVSQPDRPAGRKRTPTPTPIARFAAEHAIECVKPEDVNDPDVIQRIHADHADAFVVIAFGQKLSEQLLDDHFAINLHASLLPKYRGAAPINWAIIHNEKQTGLSVIELANRMDAGAIFGQSITPIDPMETAGELHDRLAKIGPELVLDVLDRFENDTLTSEPQDATLATKAPKFRKADGTVHFDQSAELVRARVHGLTPWPGCRVVLGETTLRLHRVAVVDDESDTDETDEASIGMIVDDDCVQCQHGRIRLLAIQPSGGKMMSFEAWKRGHSLPNDARLLPLNHESGDDR